MSLLEKRYKENLAQLSSVCFLMDEYRVLLNFYILYRFEQLLIFHQYDAILKQIL